MFDQTRMRFIVTRAGLVADKSAFGALGGADAVLAPELVYATAGVNDLLLARIERVASRAHFNSQIVAQC